MPRRLDTEILYGMRETEASLNVLAKELLRLYLAQPQGPVKESEVAFHRALGKSR